MNAQPDPKTQALQTLHGAITAAKPTLNVRDPQERELWEALEKALTAILKLPLPR
jgi:hypothetical protein